MRTALRLGAALSVGWMVACGGEPGADSAALRVPERDLTLQRPAPQVVEVASPVELARSRPEVRTPRRPRAAPKPAPAPESPEAPDAAPTPQPVVALTPAVERPSEAVAEAEAATGSDRELAPGKTVTVIPASAGPSTASDEIGMPPARASRGIFIGGGGGTCRPRRGGGVRGLGPPRPLAGRLRL